MTPYIPTRPTSVFHSFLPFMISVIMVGLSFTLGGVNAGSPWLCFVPVIVMILCAQNHELRKMLVA